MALFNSLLQKFFGTKAERDLKEINPYVGKIQEVYGKIDALSNDQLRGETARLKQFIAQKISDEESRIAELKAKLEDVMIDVSEKEDLATEVDKNNKRVDEKIEEALREVLPEAFAIMKSTARRFKENETLEVTAQSLDRDIAAKHDYVEITGDKAIWKNTWMAGGNRIK
ncbi:MAG: preprotein translocase subunit SecA, partial [Bacteroidales bacterium]|nr:preprotein translocase subunit SecA [Bacteroidales bacterium]